MCFFSFLTFIALDHIIYNNISIRVKNIYIYKETTISELIVNFFMTFKHN